MELLLKTRMLHMEFYLWNVFIFFMTLLSVAIKANLSYKILEMYFSGYMKIMKYLIRKMKKTYTAYTRRVARKFQ